MQPEELTALFDRQAASYDQQWQKLAPLNSALHLLTTAFGSKLPANARVLCVGAGTGVEILHLARAFPDWRFTAVEPSVPMLERFQRKAADQGLLPRCVLHAGYLDTLPATDDYDVATAFLVSQFILERDRRTAFFQSIARRLRPGGRLLSSDLAGNLESEEGQALLEMWFEVMSGGGIPPDGVARMREAYRRDVAVIPPEEVRNLIAAGGFESPTQFFQAGLIHAWQARRSRDLTKAR
jgi:tRNA (cmo5U34)-methyltransferase